MDLPTMRHYSLCTTRTASKRTSSIPSLYYHLVKDGAFPAVSEVHIANDCVKLFLCFTSSAHNAATRMYAACTQICRQTASHFSAVSRADAFTSGHAFAVERQTEGCTRKRVAWGPLGRGLGLQVILILVYVASRRCSRRWLRNISFTQPKTPECHLKGNFVLRGCVRESPGGMCRSHSWCSCWRAVLFEGQTVYRLWHAEVHCFVSGPGCGVRTLDNRGARL